MAGRLTPARLPERPGNHRLGIIFQQHHFPSFCRRSASYAVSAPQAVSLRQRIHLTLGDHKENIELNSCRGSVRFRVPLQPSQEWKNWVSKATRDPARRPCTFDTSFFSCDRIALPSFARGTARQQTKEFVPCASCFCCLCNACSFRSTIKQPQIMVVHPASTESPHDGAASSALRTSLSLWMRGQSASSAV